MERGDDQALRIDAELLFGRGVSAARGWLAVAFRLMDLYCSWVVLSECPYLLTTRTDYAA